MFDKDQPLWLPKGSIRALIAMSLIGASIYAGLVLRELGESAGLFVMGMAVVKDYFEARKNGAI